ncbi:Copia protein, partial [Durusdinium trenchii]
AEVSWATLDKTQRAAMANAKQLEVDQWLGQKVREGFVGIVPPGPPGRLTRTRWALVFKKVDDDPIKVKCKAITPTSLWLSCHRRWPQWKADAKSTFLQGGETPKSRDIFLQPVAELAAGLQMPPNG